MSTKQKIALRIPRLAAAQERVEAAMLKVLEHKFRVRKRGEK